VTAPAPDAPGRVVPVNDLPGHGTVSSNLPTPSSALAIGAHPDDIEFGCGGTLAKWASAGTAIHHLVLTDGSKGTWDPGRHQASLIAERQEEQRKAAAVLRGGAGDGDVIFLSFVDGELHNAAPAQWEVARCIRLLRPEVVLGHDPWRRYRLHPDHRHAGYITTDSIVAARDPHFFADQELEPHRPHALLLWEADEPNHVEDVAGFEEVKIAALLAHCSQHESTLGISAGDTSSQRAAFARRIRAQLGEHAALAGLSTAESFHLMTDI
jgi:LmbE family N-acetylglucosaminyl deacetylase